jgi:hypothetical protein
MHRAYELQGHQRLSLRVGSNIIQVPHFVISGGIQYLCHKNMEKIGHVPHFVIWVELNIGHFLHFSPVFLVKQLTLFKTPNPKISPFPLFIFRPKIDKSIGLGARLQVFYIV